MNITTTGTYSPTSTRGTATVAQDNLGLSINDFFKLMAAQLQNQNMMDPVDNSQFIAQMAQFSTLTQMQELQKVGQMTYAVSLIGKNVMVSNTDENGISMIASGVVNGISFENGIPYIGIGGASYQVSDILAVENG
jgi:flagellar basal-body rod modification protein FlgD